MALGLGNAWWELMEDKGCLSEFEQVHFGIDSQILVIGLFFSSWYRKGTFLMGNFMICFQAETGNGESPSGSCYFSSASGSNQCATAA